MPREHYVAVLRIDIYIYYIHYIVVYSSRVRYITY